MVGSYWIGVKYAFRAPQTLKMALKHLIFSISLPGSWGPRFVRKGGCVRKRLNVECRQKY